MPSHLVAEGASIDPGLDGSNLTVRELATVVGHFNKAVIVADIADEVAYVVAPVGRRGIVLQRSKILHIQRVRRQYLVFVGAVAAVALLLQNRQHVGLVAHRLGEVARGNGIGAIGIGASGEKTTSNGSRQDNPVAAKPSRSN